MDRPLTHKPIPARLAEAPAVPARPSDGLESPAAPSPRADAGGERGATEASFEHRGESWQVQVLGRSGRAGGRSPQLLLLGFSPGHADGAVHRREALVAARSLEELSDERLSDLLGEAVEPPPDTRRPFFEAVGQGRRGGPPGDG